MIKRVYIRAYNEIKITLVRNNLIYINIKETHDYYYKNYKYKAYKSNDQLKLYLHTFFMRDTFRKI